MSGHELQALAGISKADTKHATSMNVDVEKKDGALNFNIFDDSGKTAYMGNPIGGGGSIFGGNMGSSTGTNTGGFQA